MTDVDMMTAIVLEQLDANREQLPALEPARRSSHLLDDHAVERIKQVFGVQCDDMWLWVETGKHWQAQDLNAATAARPAVRGGGGFRGEQRGHLGAGR